ncbi:hypothetical protein [Carnobacterium maltaromaticum]|uniref:hypothetical protein n=1 Tax=Carnobacterium maltaromaticum TaxID=2751 RepID=UPI0012F781D1|nr:hypothetical protein [Carnobacterium maltaromaticum]
MKLSLSKNSRLFCLVATLLLSLFPFFVTGSCVYAAENQEIEIESFYFSNQDVFDSLEKSGYDIHDIFTDEQITIAKAQDRKRAGTNSVFKVNDELVDVYLNSIVAGAIKYAGVGAIALIPGVSPYAAAIVSGVIGQEIDTSRGIIVRIEIEWIGSFPNHTPLYKFQGVRSQ